MCRFIVILNISLFRWPWSEYAEAMGLEVGSSDPDKNLGPEKPI